VIVSSIRCLRTNYIDVDISETWRWTRCVQCRQWYNNDVLLLSWSRKWVTSLVNLRISGRPAWHWCCATTSIYRTISSPLISNLSWNVFEVASWIAECMERTRDAGDPILGQVMWVAKRDVTKKISPLATSCLHPQTFVLHTSASTGTYYL